MTDEVAARQVISWRRAASPMREACRLSRRHSMLVAGVMLTVGWIAAAVFLPAAMRMDPIAQDTQNVLSPPGLRSHHLLGTDQLGRDVMARLVLGARVSLLIGWLSVTIAAIIGLVLGLLAAYYGGWLDSILMRVAEAQMSFPFVLLALLIMSVVIPGPGTIIGMFAFVGWPLDAKVVRGAVLSLNQEEYIMAARALGARDWRIIRRHLLPNVLPLLFVLMPLHLSQIVFTEAGLSFIGVGVQPPHPSWGFMLADSRIYMTVAWWLPVLPGVALLLTVLGANLLGDGLQEVLDPKRKVALGDPGAR